MVGRYVVVSEDSQPWKPVDFPPEQECEIRCIDKDLQAATD